jgi:hypothetical protein
MSKMSQLNTIVQGEGRKYEVTDYIYLGMFQKTKDEILTARTQTEFQQIKQLLCDTFDEVHSSKITLFQIGTNVVSVIYDKIVDNGIQTMHLHANGAKIQCRFIRRNVSGTMFQIVLECFRSVQISSQLQRFRLFQIVSHSPDSPDCIVSHW